MIIIALNLQAAIHLGYSQSLSYYRLHIQIQSIASTFLLWWNRTTAFTHYFIAARDLLASVL